MPLITKVFLGYAAGLLVGFSGAPVSAGCLVFIVLFGVVFRSAGVAPALICGGVVVLGAMTGVRSRSADERCREAILKTGIATVELLAPLAPGGNAPSVTVGACRLRVYARASPAHAFDVGTRLRLEGVFARAGAAITARQVESVLLERPSALVRLRIATGRRLDRLYKSHGPLARALVVADQHDLDKDLRERFADAGIIHMVSVSGLHISIIGSALLGLLLACGINKQRASLVGICCIATYVVFIGAPPPAVRSAVMFSAGGVCQWLQRPTSTWAVWAVSCGVSLADPWIVLDLGWQLSAAGMAGLIASGILIERIGTTWTPATRTILSGVTATAVASLVTTPIIAWTFERISIAACLTNLAAAPLFNVAQPLLFLSVIASLIWPLGQFVADAARTALMLVDLVARIGAALPFAVVRAEADVVTALALVLLAVCAVVACASTRRRGATGWGLAALACVAWWPMVRPGNGQLEIHMIDVGQGDAVALRSPRGRWMLIDAGRAWPGGDAGQRVVWPYLRRRGGDVVHFVMTHPHLDHIGGGVSVLKRAKVDTVWDSGFPGNSSAYTALLKQSVASGAVWKRAVAGDSVLFDGLIVRVLFPTDEWLRAQRDANDASVVLQVIFGETRILLTGDAEERAEHEIVARYGDALKSDVLKLGHHGSATSTSLQFLESVRPTLALISVGVLNDYRHPSPSVLQRLSENAVNVLRTDDDGTIVLISDGRTFKVSNSPSRW